MTDEDGIIEDEIARRGRETLHLSLTAGRWSLLNTIVQNALAYLTFFITARLLTPADFGLIAVAAIVPGLLDSFTAIAFGSAAIQKRSGEEVPYLNAMWTFEVLRAVSIFLVVYMSAPFIAAFFHAEEFTPLFRFGGLVFLAQSASNVGQIYFFKNLDFKKVFIRDLVWKGSLAALSIGLALLLRSYWALFVANVLATVAASVVSYTLSPYRPRFDFRLGILRDLFPFSQWMFGQGLVLQIARAVEDSTVARFTNPTEVGLFTKAKALGNAPIAPVVSLINKIGFSAYARVQDSLAHVREGFYKSFDLLLAIALPFLAAIYIGGNRIILILLGEQWIPAVAYLKVLATAAAIDILTITLIGPLLNAMGHPKSQFAGQTLYLGALVVSVFLLAPIAGAYGVALAMLVAACVSGAFALVMLNHYTSLSAMRLISSLVATSAALLIPVPLGLHLIQFPFTNTTLGFLLLGSVIGALYFGTLALCGMWLRIGPWNTLMVIIRSFLPQSS